MQHLNRALAVGALTITFVLAGCSAPGTSSTTAPEASASAAATESAAPSGSAGSSEANAADETFVTGMIPHHEQAIEMSDVVLAKDDLDPAVRDLAQQIKDAQEPEIEQLHSWLGEWGIDHDEMETGGGHGGHGGMMTEEDMQALEDASGADASRLFLEQMIVHHQGAVEMAETELAEGQHPDVLALAQTIADAQAGEIAEMEQLLTQM